MFGGSGNSRMKMEGTVHLRVDLRNSPFEGVTGGNGVRVLERIARLNGTWKEFLMNECGLQLEGVGGSGSQFQPIYICNKSYVATSRMGKSEHDMGWKAGLEERVGDFVAKYKRNRSVYTVRLTHGLGPGRGRWEAKRAAVRDIGGSGNRVSQVASVPPAPALAPIPIPTYRPTHQTQRNVKVEDGRMRMPSTSNSSGQARPEHGASSSKSSDHARSDLMDTFLNDVVTNHRRRNGQDSDSEFEVDLDGDDDASDGTAANDEKAELNADGIQVENLMPRIKLNLQRLDNTLFLRAKKEIKRLRASGLWTKHQKRAPFVSIVMEELLRAPRGK